MKIKDMFMMFLLLSVVSSSVVMGAASTEPIPYTSIQECKDKHITIEGKLSLKYRRDKIHGHSMEPLLKEGDYLWTLRVSPRDELLVDDIIVYWEAFYYIAHRVVEVHDGWYSTKGDNNLARDFMPPNDEDIRHGLVHKTWMATRNGEVIYCAQNL